MRFSLTRDNNCIPVKVGLSPYIRLENDTSCSILDPLSEVPNYLNINKTATIILDSIDGLKTAEEIAEIYRSRYSHVKTEVLDKDLEQLINKLWRKGIITWKEGKYPMNDEFQNVINENEVLCGAFENNFVEIKEFINKVKTSNNFYKYENPYYSNTEISDVQLRKSLFEMTTIYIFKMDKTGDHWTIKGLFVGTVMPGVSTCLNIGMLYAKENDVKTILSNVAELAKKMSVVDLTKIRIYVMENDEILKKNITECIGWKTEAVLEKEQNQKRIISYVKYLDE